MKSKLLSLGALLALVLVCAVPALAKDTESIASVDKAFVVSDTATDAAVTKMVAGQSAADVINIAAVLSAPTPAPSYTHDQALQPGLAKMPANHDDKGVQAYAATRSRLW